MSSLMPSLSIQEANDLFGSSSEDENDDDEERNQNVPFAIQLEMKNILLKYRNNNTLNKFNKSMYEKYLMSVKLYECNNLEELLSISSEIAIITYNLLKEHKGWPHQSVKDLHLLSQLFLAHNYVLLKQFKTCIQCIDKIFTVHGASKIVTMYLSLIIPKIESSNAFKLSPSGKKIEFVQSLYVDKILIPEMNANNNNRQQIPKMKQCSLDIFKKEFLNTETAIIFTDIMAKENGYSGAINKWKDINFWINNFGYRFVPIEIGRFPQFCEEQQVENTFSSWKEEMITIENFFNTYLIPSIQRIEMRQKRNGNNNDDDNNLEKIKDQLNVYKYLPAIDTVAYLAQHNLFEQFKILKNDIGTPKYCHIRGRKVQHVNMWFGTDGTVTPLHFDSYDNFLMQVIGYKYVRLYEKSQTKYLYRDNTGVEYAQGNMTNVSIEYPDKMKHPEFGNAKYTETILMPGDTLFIPSGMWHYVRSLTPSLSINYWF